MRIVAAPGLMTLLDLALFRTVEGQLTGTLTTSHALLEAWLALQRQAVIVLQEFVPTPSGGGGGGANNYNHSLNNTEQKRILQMESFARACFEAACDAIQLINTDRLASLGNLSDPYYSSATASQQQQQTRSGSGLLFLSMSNSSPEELMQALQESVLDTGRRRYPLQQRRKDCWESPRLFCPDHVWADEVWQAGQHVLRQLHKQPYATALHKKHLTSVEASLSGSLPLTALTSSSLSSSSRGNKASATNHTKAKTIFISDKSDSLLEEQMHLLWLILSKDLPTRLIQFKAAMEAEAAVTKRLYLIKCEYRAPFRAFLESHHAVQRAPSLELVDEYLSLTGNSRNNRTVEQRRETLKDRFQSLLKTPQLVEALALEQRCEEYESAMAAALFPFCELARYLDQKRARIRRENVRKQHHLTERLRRFKGLLLYRSGSSSGSSGGGGGSADVASSSGIRPLLLDLQGVPTDEEAKAAVLGIGSKRQVNAAVTDMDDSTSSSSSPAPPVLDVEIALERVDHLLADLQALGTLCETRNAFLVESGKKSDSFDLPASIVRGCTDDLDAELFRCHFQDLCAMVLRQHALTNNTEFERLAEKLRRAEMQMGLASASNKSLQVIRQRLETLSTDREKRFEVLKAMLEEVCLREMNLHVTVEAPGQDKILSLPKMTALGVFGRALQLAGEPLPIG